MDRPDVDFDADLFEGDGDEFVEVIKGKEGRIAVKSTNMLYEILVWLPKFSYVSPSICAIRRLRA